ncbi:MAG: hypothetical protein ACTSWY_01860 [Promethearchaeota archaeon]
MTWKTWRTAFLVCLCFLMLFFNIVFLNNIGIKNSNADHFALQKENIKSSEIFSFNQAISPFFNHSENDIEIYNYLAHEYTPDFSIFRHSLNNTDGIVIENTNHYSADQFYYMMGMGNLIYESEKSEILELFDSYIETPLADDGVDGGFYHKIDENFNVVSESKLCFDNLLAIMSLFNALDYGASSRILSQWDIVKTLFWDSEGDGFNHSTGIESNERYSEDNFLSAIISFNIAKELGGDTGDSFNYGNDTIMLFNSSMYDEDNPSFYSYMNQDGEKNGTTDKSLLPNALGISALLEWNIAINFDQNSSKVIQAENVWKYINEHLYNNSYDMYMSKINEDGTNLLDYNMNLLENAWMLRATLDLFQTTGNITYYKSALKHFYGIEDNLYDSNNNGYDSSFGPSGTDIKSVDSYNMLLAVLHDFYNIYSSTSVTVNVNQTEFYYLIDSAFNASVNFNFSLNFDYTSSVGANWVINSFISDAPLEYTLRFKENSTIICEDLTHETGIKGNDTYSYSFPVSLPVNTYKLSVFCNKSGYGIAFTNEEIKIVSGIGINNIDDLFNLNSLHQGEIGGLNITVSSSLSENLTVSVKTWGGGFSTVIKTGIKIINETETNIIINASVKENAGIGEQQIKITIYYDSITLLDVNYSIEIVSSFEVGVLRYGRIIDLNAVELSMPLTNLSRIPTGQVNISVYGTYFEDSNIDINTLINDIPFQETEYLEFSLNPTSDAQFGILIFTLNFSRNGEVFYSEMFSVESVPEIEILKISESTTILQGQAPTISVKLVNYNLSSQTVIIKSNGVISSELTVQNGESLKKITIDAPLINPYDVTQKIYMIEILDENGNNLAAKTVYVNLTPSLSNVFYFYVIPIIIPVVLIVLFKHKELEFEKRNK